MTFFVAGIWVLSLVMAVSWQLRRGSRTLPEGPHSWVELAPSLGLAYVPPNSTHLSRMQGALGGLRVVVEVEAERPPWSSLSPRHVKILIDGTGQLPVTVNAAPRRQGEGPGVRTGDEDFDREVLLRGPEPLLVAAASADTRRMLGAFLRLASGHIEHGTARAQGPIEDRHVAEVIRFGTKVLETLTRSGQDAPELLLANALSERLEGVRLRNLALLCSAFPDASQTRRAADALLHHADPRLRVLSAHAIKGTQGRRVLQAVISDASLGSGVRLGALEHLLTDHSYFGNVESIDVALRSGEENLQGCAVRAAGRVRDVARVEQLAALGAGASEYLAEDIAKAMGQLADARAEPSLLELLAHPAEAVALSAIDALGTCGTARSVERLLPLTQGLLNAERRARAKDAVRSIQARLGPVEAGRLSLSEARPGEGGLSFPSVEGGLSHPPPSESEGEGDS